jgi:hypothetical protein
VLPKNRLLGRAIKHRLTKYTGKSDMKRTSGVAMSTRAVAASEKCMVLATFSMFDAGCQ